MAPLRELTRADEITAAVEAVLPELPSSFTGTEVSDAFAARGLDANRSTLRGKLQIMAGIGRSFVVEMPGKGRRSTVYRKL